MSSLNLTTSTTEAPEPIAVAALWYFLSTLPELIVDASITLGLKSKQSLNSNISPDAWDV